MIDWLREGSQHRLFTLTDFKDLVDFGKHAGVIGTVVATAVAAGIIYVIGGVAMMIRLIETDIPVEQGLIVIPRDVLLVLGVREFIVAAIVTVLLCWFLRRRLLVVGGIVLLAVTVPWTIGGAIWPIGLVAVLLSARSLSKRNHAAWTPLVALFVVLVAVLMRYTDGPYRLARVSVWTDAPAVETCGTNAQGERASYCGAYLSSTSDNVFLGNPDSTKTSDEDESRVVTIPREGVEQVVLFPPPGGDLTPRTSLLGRIVEMFGGPALSCNPLECWVDDENYGSRVFG